MSEQISLKNELKELIKEIMLNHEDPYHPDYNECDKPGEKCMWCIRAKKALEELDKVLGNVSYESR